MALTSKEALYTDKDPNGLEVGRVLREGDPDARFVLIGEGGVLSDELEAKYGAAIRDHEATIKHDAVAAKAELVAANLATYEENARTIGGPQFKGIPGNLSNPLGVKPDEQEKAQAAVENIANGDSATVSKDEHDALRDEFEHQQRTFDNSWQQVQGELKGTRTNLAEANAKVTSQATEIEKLKKELKAAKSQNANS